MQRSRPHILVAIGIGFGLTDGSGNSRIGLIMRRILLPKREWVRYLAPLGEFLNERGWPLHPGLAERIRSAGFDQQQPVEGDFVPGTLTLRLRQFPDA